METDLTNVENMRAVGLRPTRQRLALARLLFGHGNQHVTAETLFERAQMAGIKVSLATVYNTLHQFTDAGLLRQVMVDTLRSYFDTNITDHHHFYFEDTGKIADIPHDRINQQINDISPTILPAGTSLSRVDVVVRLRGAE
jgi:Fur family iron response transcriptional regulator